MHVFQRLWKSFFKIYFKTNSDMLTIQDIVVATPGRLRDLIQDGICNLGEVSFVVREMCEYSVLSWQGLSFLIL